MKYLFFFLLFSGFTVFAQVPESFSGFMRKKENAYFFYEVRHDSLLPPRYVVFADNDTIGLYKATIYEGGMRNNGKYIRAWGNKKDTTTIKYNGFPYSKITVTGVKAYSLGNFILDHYGQVKQAEKDTIMEGYYMHRFEGYLFFPITNGRVNQNRGWTYFETGNIDSINHANNGKLLKGIYMKLKGKVKYGYPFGYGHFGMSAFKFNVDEIIDIDTSRVLNAHLARDMETSPIIKLGDTIHAPKDFNYNAKYRYTGKFRRYSVEVTIEKTEPGLLEYIVTYRKGKTVEQIRRGKLLFNSFGYPYSIRDEGHYSYEEFRWKELNGYEPNTELLATFTGLDRNTISFYFVDRMFSKKEVVNIRLEPVQN